jgi:hypothetical protein
MHSHFMSNYSKHMTVFSLTEYFCTVCTTTCAFLSSQELCYHVFVLYVINKHKIKLGFKKGIKFLD